MLAWSTGNLIHLLFEHKFECQKGFSTNFHIEIYSSNSYFYIYLNRFGIYLVFYEILRRKSDQQEWNCFWDIFGLQGTKQETALIFVLWNFVRCRLLKTVLIDKKLSNLGIQELSNINIFPLVAFFTWYFEEFILFYFRFTGNIEHLKAFTTSEMDVDPQLITMRDKLSLTRNVSDNVIIKMY